MKLKIIMVEGEYWLRIDGDLFCSMIVIGKPSDFSYQIQKSLAEVIGKVFDFQFVIPVGYPPSTTMYDPGADPSLKELY